MTICGAHLRARQILFRLMGLVVISLLCPIVHGQQYSGLTKIEVGKDAYFGKPLGWDGKRFALLGRDGRLDLVPAQSHRKLQLVSDQFEPFTGDQLQSILLNKYRNRYDVSKTENFVVVHPWGDPQIWAQPFEDFHKRFIQYFESQGIELDSPNGPLIAFVLRSRNDFDRSLINEVESRDSRIAGFYSRITNQITTYDPGGYVRTDKDKWLYSAWPVIHEATHQSAFNTGLHNRFAPPPKWLSEGLATMFEAKGFNHQEGFSKPAHRVNIRRLKLLRKYLDSADFDAGLLNLISNDKLFVTHIELAYSLSWGLSFYLAETKPDEFFQFIKRDAQRPNFAAYPAKSRMRDFANAFGYDFEKLNKDLKLYYRKK